MNGFKGIRNVNGRPKGALNKNTKDIKDFITNFLNEKAFEINDIWSNLNDREKVNLFIHLSKLVLPRTPEIETDTEEKENEVVVTIVSDYSNLPLNERLEKLHLTQNEVYDYLKKIRDDLENEY